MGVLEKISHILNRFLIVLAGLFLAAMILMTCMNIFSRLFWSPFKGTYELMGYFGAMVTAFALSYTQIKKAHISVDVLVGQFSQKTQLILQGFNCLVCMVFFSIAGWQINKLARTLWQTGEVTETLRIIYYPFTYGVALGCCLLAFVLLVEFLKLIFAAKGAH
ncbi:MAG: TRAP transporter small permease [Deltaproteobacteria bacterium]|jgi:TRAP-type C4-dicarboxylate transport system permease small subunit|nr:TRAP transporter small permease [Deltaproteobacteria bacterium]MBW2516629.1 TRAP transporter small permease [Deltaproteobacteria bacterium]